MSTSGSTPWSSAARRGTSCAPPHWRPGPAVRPQRRGYVGKWEKIGTKKLEKNGEKMEKKGRAEKNIRTLTFRRRPRSSVCNIMQLCVSSILLKLCLIRLILLLFVGQMKFITNLCPLCLSICWCLLVFGHVPGCALMFWLSGLCCWVPPYGAHK